MKDVAGKVIWIIGASSGIGAALASELDARGAHLVLSARRQDKLEILNNGLDGKHLVAPLDIGDVEATQKTFEKIIERYSQLDSAIFMAARYAFHGTKLKDINYIHSMLHTNLGGAFNMLNSVQPYFAERGSGQIVLCGSIAGYRGLPTGQPYCAAKAALINLGESLKIEMQPKGVDVKIICPGFVKTPLTDKNDFPMPMMIGADKAAKQIANGLTRRAFEIHFPKKFTYLMKLVRLLPAPLYFFLMRKIIKR